MYYTNSMKLTLKNNNAAVKARKVLRSQLAEGFDVDNHYQISPSQSMSDALEVIDNTIELPVEFGCYIPEDAEGVQVELIKHLAASFVDEEFSVDCYNYCDSAEGEINARYENGILRIQATYYPWGYYEYLPCDECGGDTISFDEYEAGKLYICPECGEELDLSKAYEEIKPVITNLEIRIK